MHFHRREDFAEALAGEGVDELVHQAAGPLDGGKVGVHHVLLFGVIALHALTPITREQPRAGHEAWTPRVRLKQVLRSRASRALAQDDTLTRGLRNLCTTRCVALGVGARGAYTRGHSEPRHGDVCLPEPAPRLPGPPSWRPRVSSALRPDPQSHDPLCRRSLMRPSW